VKVIAPIGMTVGTLLYSKLRQRIDALDVEGYPRPDVKHGDVVTAAIALLCSEKSEQLFRNLLGFCRCQPARARQ
jgi:hypothetical protein